MMEIKTIFKNWSFLMVMIIVYVVLAIIDFDLFGQSLSMFFDILLNIIPVFLLVLLLMTLTNYFITSKFIVKHMQARGIKKWIIIIVGGILSTGPIYMWYPLLKDLKQKGLSDGLIAAFLYNRAIKIPLLPMALYYFGAVYVFVLVVVMIFVSVFQSIIINFLMEVRK